MTKEVLQQTQKSEKIKGIEVLPKEGIPLLVISNHCFSLKFLPIIKRFMKYRSDTTMVANAGFTPFLGMLGINSIAVNSLEHKPSGNLIKDSWGRIIRLSGNLAQARQKSTEGNQLVENTISKLSSGGAVWITPASLSEHGDEKIRWKLGLAYMLKKIISNGQEVKIAMVHISDMGQATVTHTCSVQDIMSENNLNLSSQPREMTQALQDSFWNHASLR